MNKFIILLATALPLIGCSQVEEPTELTVAEPALNSGIDREGMDPDVRPQDDFFAYANGRWVEATEIPSDQSGWGSFHILADNASMSPINAVYFPRNSTLRSDSSK